MSDHLRIPFAQSMDKATNRLINEAIERLGYALPCTLIEVHGPIVTVQIEVQDGVHTFPPITLPVHQSQYIREPFQPGDQGVVFPIGVYIGGISGLGGGQADGTPQGNLSTLVFFPVGHKNWENVDGGKVVMRGPTGVQIGQLESGCTIIADASGITQNNGTIIVQNGNIIAVDVTLHDHVHKDVQPGGGRSGPPVPGT